MSRIRRLLLLAAATLPVVSGGCNPFTIGIFTPIPVQPWVAERMDEKKNHKNDGRVPIMPPIRSGYPLPICEDPPSDGEVLRAMPRVARGIPYVYEEFRDDIVIVKNRLVDKIDPPRFYPLVGWARLHHCHYKCTVYYTETRYSHYPFPWRTRKPRVEVVYIDKDHLHAHPGGSPEANREFTRDLSGF